MAKRNSLNLFYTLKLDVSHIINSDEFVGVKFTEGKLDGKIVSLGDNQIFEFIRNIENVDYNKLINNIKFLIKEKESIKKLEKSKENSKKIGMIQNKINELMFNPHIISVRCDTENATKKQYKELCKHGFRVKSEVNGKIYDFHYKRLCAGAGQLRRNTAIFVNSDLYSELEKIMMCGLDKKKVGKMNLAKFSAYYALYSSATNKVTTPRICVINDFKHILKDEKISWIFDNEHGEKDIEVREMEVEINAFDGSGIVSPEFAEVWQNDLNLDYTPSSFILRSAWIKGLVSVFDFHEFAKTVAKKSYIIDAWGNKQYVKDIDVILTTSQFKMWKKYTSWEEYCGYHQKFNHVFGIARVNKKYDNFFTTMNYQYVQSNNFTKDSVCRLADYTLDWITKIMSGDELYTSLFLLGIQDDSFDVDEVENKLNTFISKAVMYNKDILKDDYVRMKINQLIQTKVDQLKIGKCLVEGSYDFAIPDLYAMAEHAFKMEVKGLLGRKQCWSKRWVDKGSNVVAIMRSPLVAPAENQLTNIVDNDKLSYWFRYIKSGLVVNAWDTTMNRCSDADFDGDLILTSDNKYLLDAVDDEAYPIMYEKKIIKEHAINPSAFADMDVKSFDTKIGFITNLASCFIAMRSTYDKDTAEYKELTKRIDLLRYYQGVAIDSTKGDVFTPPPKKWSKKQRFTKYEECKTDEDFRIRNKILFENSICANKKPYFFCYIYPSLMNDYKEVLNEYKDSFKRAFRKKINEVVYSKEKTNDEKNMVFKYMKSIPVLKNNCIMNILCKYVESKEFENKWKLENKDVFDFNILKTEKLYKLSKSEKLQINNICSRYDKRLSEIMKYIKNEELDVESKDILIELERDTINNMLLVCSNNEDLTNYVVDLYYGKFKNRSKNILWNVLKKQILCNVKSHSKTILVPIESSDGTDYLGSKYILKEIEL